MTIRHRAIEIPRDAWPVRDFLTRLWPLAPVGTVWEVRRWDGSLFHTEEPALAPERAVRSRLWVTEAGRIVAAALSEGDTQIHPHVAPEADDLLEEVVAWSEEAGFAAGDEEVLLHVWDHDEAGRRVATTRGYVETDAWEVVRTLRLGGGLPPVPPLPQGYVLRTTRDDTRDHDALADLLNAAFGRTGHVGAERANFQRLAPSFRRETDLVAEAPDGSLAAYAAVCWDTCNRHAIFEPVCTHPEHRRRGLAKALMLEGLRRAEALGAEIVQVGTGSADPANALYDSLPFTATYRGRFWARAAPRRSDA
jgi:mycothiol synthase